MGSVLSALGFQQQVSKKAAFYLALRSDDELLLKLKSVGLDAKQLQELFHIFSEMDKDNSGEITMLEFFDYIDLNRSRFSEKAFAVMDRDGSGEVDFLEFVLAVWNYCSFNQASLVRFAFDLYDVDGSGEIERDEVGMCIREVWGSDWESNSAAQKIMTKLETIMESTVSGRLTVKLFQEFALRHPMLLFPAFQLQTEIQNKVLGERFWTKAAKRRGSMNPEDMQWGNMQAMAKLAKKSSSQLLKAIEDDLGEQVGKNLRPKHAPTGGKKRGAASVGAIVEEHTTSKSRSSIPNSKGTASTPTSPTAGTTTRHKRRWSDQAGVSKAAIAGLIVENLDDSSDD